MEKERKLLLTSEDVKPSFNSWNVEGVLNPAAVRMSNKKIILYARVAETQGNKKKKGIYCPIIISKKQHKAHYQHIGEDKILQRKKDVIFLKDGTCRLPTISHLRRIVLDESGFEVEKIDEKPTFTGVPRESEYGVEDPRITVINGKFYMTYVGVSQFEGVSSYLAVSNDLKKWKRLGIIFREQNKDAVLFPEKCNNRYVALNRPESLFEFSKPGIWISHSPDLKFWGMDKHLIRPRKNSWESERVGAGCPPIKTKRGWLLIYHGVEKVENSRVYSAGGALLDLRDPEIILARSPLRKPLFGPSSGYEKKGFVNNVVFPTGAIMDINGEDLLIYYGAADSRIAVRRMNLHEILEGLQPYQHRLI